MPDELKPRDSKFPNYGYAKKPLVNVYSKRKGGSKVANLFIGEWLKILDTEAPFPERVYVRYRGGKGYIKKDEFGYQRYLEIFFIDVDQGDSILIQTPDDRRVLIDGGRSKEAHTFIRDKYNLYKKDNYIDFEAVVATHSDNDHSEGLIHILKDPKIAVKRFYHNGIFKRQNDALNNSLVRNNRMFGLLDKPKLDESPQLSALMKRLIEAVTAAEKNLPVAIEKMKQIERWKERIDMPEGGFVCERLDAARGFLPPYDDKNKHLTIEVLWPKAGTTDGKLSYPHYGDFGKTVNGNSIVLAVKHGKCRIMLAGDLNEKSMDDVVKLYGKGGKKASERLRMDVYKAAHHGSQDFSLPFLKAVKPDAAVISSGDDRNDVHGHPRAVLMGTITRYSRKPKPAVFSTELAACFSPVTVNKKVRDAYLEGRGQMYEKSINGIVHLRSDKKKIYLGTVHGRKPEGKAVSYKKWKWDIWPEE